MAKKTRYKLGERFPCKCGNKILLDGVWLAAHWQEWLTTKCSQCGQQQVVFINSGRSIVTNELQEALDMLKRRPAAQRGQKCVSCGGPAEAFRDVLSKWEYAISALCQQCQDRVFGGEEA